MFLRSAHGDTLPRSALSCNVLLRLVGIGAPPPLDSPSLLGDGGYSLGAPAVAEAFPLPLGLLFLRSPEIPELHIPFFLIIQWLASARPSPFRAFFLLMLVDDEEGPVALLEPYPGSSESWGPVREGVYREPGIFNSVPEVPLGVMACLHEPHGRQDGVV